MAQDVVTGLQRLIASNPRDMDEAQVQAVGLEGQLAQEQGRADDTAEPIWRKRVYDLDALTSVDLIASYWMGEPLAHTMRNRQKLGAFADLQRALARQGALDHIGDPAWAR